MTPEEKLIEKRALSRGYATGYAAGKKRKKSDEVARQHAAKKQAFRHRAFLVALGAVINSPGWTQGDAPISSLADRTALANRFANEAMKYF